MQGKRYKLYLASGIRLWTMYFQKEYSDFFNKKVDLFQPALIDKQYTGDHRLIPIRIATKDLGEINTCDAVLAYMKMYDTKDNGPAGTDSTWECGYAIGAEKPTIMLVENLEHLDYYSAQWMVTFSIGAILTTDKRVAEQAKNHDKFTHTTIIYCTKKEEFETNIIEYLDNYYKSVYAREGKINYSVDQELRAIASKESISEHLLNTVQNGNVVKAAQYFQKITPLHCEIFTQPERAFQTSALFEKVCDLEVERAKVVQEILQKDNALLVPFLQVAIQECVKSMDGAPDTSEVASMISYWLNIPAAEVRGHKQGKKKTRPTIFYELYDLVSHHITASDRYFNGGFVYKVGAVLEVYNWLNTYAIDDVFDNSSTRQGQATLHVQFRSRKNAMLLGAIGHCYSLLLLHELTQEHPRVAAKLLNALNAVEQVIYVGQKIDLALSFAKPQQLQKYMRSNSFDDALRNYFMRIYGICGSFYEEIGRMAMEATNVGAQFFNQAQAEQACIAIAKYFGLVQMIRNDLGDLIAPEAHSGMSKGMKDTSHNDVMEGKLTLPILYVLYSTQLPGSDRKKLLSLMGKKKLTAKQHLDVSRIIWESGAIEYTMQYVEYYVNLVQDVYVRYIHETPTRLKWIIKLMDVTPLINITFRRLAYAQKWRKLEPEPLEAGTITRLTKWTDRTNFLSAVNK